MIENVSTQLTVFHCLCPLPASRKGLRLHLRSALFGEGGSDSRPCKCANPNKSRQLFSSAEMFKKLQWQTVWTQIRPSGSTLFASILNSSVMLGNYLQQTTSADDIFRCIFSWRFQRCKKSICYVIK